MSVRPDLPSRPPALVIVGAGPRGTGLVERIAANAPELYGEATPLDLHLVDPHPSGGGRVWRPDQSPLLWMNSMAEDVTVFSDDTVEQEGPIRPGPSLAEWAERVRAGALPDGSAPGLSPELAAEAAALTGRGFASRRLQSAYLAWVHEHAVAALPPAVTVHRHRCRAVRITGPRDGVQQVWLEGRAAPLAADAVVLALGHLDAEPDPQQRALAAFAAEHEPDELVYLPPEFTADSDLSRLRPGEPVIVRGFGLAFIDLMVLLTEGRGGHYEETGTGELTYRPSGREPVLHVGSRRGVPYRSKIGYGWRGERPPLPRFFGPAQVAELLRRPGRPDYRRDIWPLIAKELGFAHYHQLFTAHPDRTATPWPDFEERYAACPPDGPELRALVAAAVPDPADRLDLDALDRPLAGRRFDSHEALQQGLRAHIEADLARRHDPGNSPDLALFLALLSVYGQLTRLGDVGGQWHGFFSYLASGPPGPRLRQLLALSRAGVVRFLGAEVRVVADPLRKVFRASGAGVAGPGVEARALVEARLPEPSVEHTRDALLRSLHRDGAAATPAGLLAVSPDDARILDRAGRPHPRRFALGPHTDARASGGFARPRTNAPTFRQNDATARVLLSLLRPLSPRAPLTTCGPMPAESLTHHQEGP
ncbi:FAD/NAD(P)-binding protein [Streptomyces sp. LZ34]